MSTSGAANAGKKGYELAWKYPLGVFNLSAALCQFVSDYGAKPCTESKECERFPKHIVTEWFDLLFCSDAILRLNLACCRGKLYMPNRPAGCHTSRKFLSVTKSSSLKWLEY